MRQALCPFVVLVVPEQSFAMLEVYSPVAEWDMWSMKVFRHVNVLSWSLVVQAYRKIFMARINVLGS